MAEKKIIYDFETVLSILVKSQEDLIEIVTKWSAMLDTTPRYVEFNLSGRDQPLVVPNIQMVVDTLNERSVPNDLRVHSVVTSTLGGAGEFNAGHVKFEGSGVRTTYGNYGIEGAAWHVTNSIAATPGLKTWPLPRYWVHSGTGENMELDIHLGINSQLPRSGTFAVSEFYVLINDSRKIMNIYGVDPAGSRYAKLTLTTAGRTGSVMWHVIAVANNPERGNSYLTLYANIME